MWHSGFLLALLVANHSFNLCQPDAMFQVWHRKGIHSFKDLFTDGIFSSFKQLQTKYDLPHTRKKLCKMYPYKVQHATDVDSQSPGTPALMFWHCLRLNIFQSLSDFRGRPVDPKPLPTVKVKGSDLLLTRLQYISFFGIFKYCKLF